MDVKPRPLSCMKKLSLTCEIKLQIHRPGIEKTLPAGPREAGSSPAGRWQGPERHWDCCAAGAGPPGAPAPLSAAAGDEGSAASLRGPAHGEGTGDRRSIGQRRCAGSGRQEAENRERCGSDGRLSRAASRHLPEVAGEKRWGELLKYVFCQAHAASPVAAPVLGMRECPGIRSPGPAGMQRPRPLRALQPAAASPARPRRACLAERIATH